MTPSALFSGPPAATTLLTLLDGLVPRLVRGDLTTERALRLVEDHLAHLFTPNAR